MMVKRSTLISNRLRIISVSDGMRRRRCLSLRFRMRLVACDSSDLRRTVHGDRDDSAWVKSR